MCSGRAAKVTQPPSIHHWHQPPSLCVWEPIDALQSLCLCTTSGRVSQEPLVLQLRTSRFPLVRVRCASPWHVPCSPPVAALRVPSLHTPPPPVSIHDHMPLASLSSGACTAEHRPRMPMMHVAALTLLSCVALMSVQCFGLLGENGCGKVRPCSSVICL